MAPSLRSNLTLSVSFFSRQRARTIGALNEVPSCLVSGLLFVLGRAGTRKSSRNKTTPRWAAQRTVEASRWGHKKQGRAPAAGLAARRDEAAARSFSFEGDGRPVQLLVARFGAVLAPCLLLTTCCAALGRSVGVCVRAGATQPASDGLGRVQRGAQ